MRENPGEGMLSWDETAFRDEHVFEIDHVPETFNHRKGQLRSLKYAPRSAVRNSCPLNTMVHEPPGTGRTTAIQELFSELNTRSSIRIVQVSCQIDPTHYAVFSRIFEHIFKYEPLSSGISFKKLLGQITDRLVESDEVLIVALGDVNYLFYGSEASDTLYSLLRAHEAHSGAHIGVIIISSDLSLDVIDELDGRIQSIFRPEEMFFPRYDVGETVDILRGRSKHGFHEDVIDAPELGQIAELTADSGGLRTGINLLHRAGLHAEMRASRTVDMEDVGAAYDRSRYVHLSRCLQGLSDPKRELVRIVAEYDGKRAGAVYDAFSEATSLGYTRYPELMNELNQLGIIETRYTGIEEHGRTRAISLAYDVDAILDRL